MPTTAEFLLEHPTCCFCGGNVPAVQRDHIPPKILFARKEWPDGYEFPACASCNQGSRQVDQVVGLFGRLSIADKHIDPNEFQKILAGVRNNMPDAEPELEVDTDESRNLFRELDEKLPDGGWIPAGTDRVAIDAEVFQRLDAIFGKIFCSLYYKHTGRIVGPGSRILRRCTTNQILASNDPFAWQQFREIQNEPIIRRNGRSLHDQFDYKWGYIRADNLFSVVFHLRNSIYGLMSGPL